MPRQYNFIYSKLVKSEDDIVGHIAYSLYKSEKVAYIEKFKEENGGKEPTEADLKPFNDMTSMDLRLDQYLKSGSDLLDQFVNQVIGSHLERFEQECNENHVDLISKALKPVKSPPLWKQYLHGISQSIIGAFAFMLIMCFILFLLKFSDHQYTITLGGSGTASVQTEQVEQNDSIR